MKIPTVEEFKNKTRTVAPAIIAGLTVGATVTAIVYYRVYNPKDKVAMQLPAEVLSKMRDEGKGIVLDSNEGFFLIKYIPNE